MCVQAAFKGHMCQQVFVGLLQAAIQLLQNYEISQILGQLLSSIFSMELTSCALSQIYGILSHASGRSLILPRGS